MLSQIDVINDDFVVTCQGIRCCWRREWRICISWETTNRMSSKPPLEYHVKVERLDPHGSVARCKFAEITLDTGVSGRGDAFNPAELLLASIAACMIKSIERVTPLLNFHLDGVEVHVRAERQDNPTKLTEIAYELIVDTQESDHRLALLHQSARKYGIVSNTIGSAMPLIGSIGRAAHE
jgi:uncharacterized OsmC-like protein